MRLLTWVCYRTHDSWALSVVEFNCLKKLEESGPAKKIQKYRGKRSIFNNGDAGASLAVFAEASRRGHVRPAGGNLARAVARGVFNHHRSVPRVASD